MWNFLFELDRNRGVDLRRGKESFRRANGEILVALRHGWVIAAKLDSLFGIALVDPNLVVKRNRRDERLDFVEAIVAASQNFQTKIDLRRCENLHRHNFSVIPSEVEQSLTVQRVNERYLDFARHGKKQNHRRHRRVDEKGGASSARA